MQSLPSPIPAPTIPGAEHAQTAAEFLRHAEGWPITVGFFMLLLILGALFAWLALKAFPEWLRQQEANRLHATNEQEKRQVYVTGLLAERGKEASADLQAANQLASLKHESIVKEIGGKVERVQDDVRQVRGDVQSVAMDVKAVAQRTHALAAKLGVSILAILTLGGASSSIVWVRAARHAAAVIVVSAAHERYADADDAKVRIKCDPACAKGQHCCGENKCCLDKSDTAGGTGKQPDKAAKAKPVPVNKDPLKPHTPQSATSFAALSHLASSLCDRRSEMCQVDRL